MIIDCECGKKKFNVDRELIPAEGRLLKCGSCSNIWHYRPDIKTTNNERKLETQNNDAIINEDDKIEKSEKNIDIGNNLNEGGLRNESKVSEFETTEENNISVKKLFYYFIILIITLVGTIFLMDTFKFQIANVFPEIIPIFDAFYQTVLDFKLFFKDLTN